MLKSDRERIERMEGEKGVKFIDGTCPLVKAVHIAANRLAGEGYQIVLVGDKNHPEVKSALSYITDPIIVEGPEDVSSVLNMLGPRIGIVSQTTQSQANVDAVEKRLRESGIKDIKVANTRCSATRERQEAAQELAKEVEVMLVIGDPNSANTKRLKEITSPIVPTHMVETKDDVRMEWFYRKDGSKADVVGVTAGASTPDWVIKGVIGFWKGALWDNDPL